MKLAIFILFVSIMNLASAAIEDPFIGRVVKIKGNIFRVNTQMKNEDILNAGSKIYEGDELNSSGGSYAKILMKDDTIFQMGPATKFKFEEFKLTTKEDRKAFYHLATGQIRSLISVKPKGNSLKLKTPSITMGIRGTEFISTVFNQNGKMETNIALLSGKLEIDLSNYKLPQVESLSLMPGMGLDTSKLSGLTNKSAIEIQNNIVNQLPQEELKALSANIENGGKIFNTIRSEKTPINQENKNNQLTEPPISQPKTIEDKNIIDQKEIPTSKEGASTEKILPKNDSQIIKPDTSVNAALPPPPTNNKLPPLATPVSSTTPNVPEIKPTVTTTPAINQIIVKPPESVPTPTPMPTVNTINLKPLPTPTPLPTPEKTATPTVTPTTSINNGGIIGN